MIFRKNYVPDLSIHQDTEGKWFAEDPHSGWSDRRSFCQLKKGSYIVTEWEEPTKFDTLDTLMAALYAYACYEHLVAVKKQITYNKVKVRL